MYIPGSIKKHFTLRMIALGPSFSETKAVDSTKDTWSIQYAWRHYKVDIAFVMDDQEWIRAKNHSFAHPIDIAQEMRDIKVPIYTAKKWEDVPNTVEYPINEILEHFKPCRYFMNSMSYMFALAIMEGYERIETYGIDLRYFNELGKKLPHHDNWLDETHCLAYWAGQAMGRGIEVVPSQRSSLMKPVKPGEPSLYGYEVSPTIQSQRDQILKQRKKVELKKEEKLLVFRPKPGEDVQEFMKRVQSGQEKPIGHTNAKLVEENVDEDKESEKAMEVQGVVNQPTS